MNASPRVGIDHLTLLDISPPELVTIAGEVGFDSVGLRRCRDPGEEPWPMAVGSPCWRNHPPVRRYRCPSAGRRGCPPRTRDQTRRLRVRAAGGSPVGSELRNGQRRRPGYRTGVRYLRNPNRRRKALWPAAPDRADYLLRYPTWMKRSTSPNAPTAAGYCWTRFISSATTVVSNTCDP